MNGLNHKFCMTDLYKRAILSLAKYESEQTPVFHGELNSHGCGLLSIDGLTDIYLKA